MIRMGGSEVETEGREGEEVSFLVVPTVFGKAFLDELKMLWIFVSFGVVFLVGCQNVEVGVYKCSASRDSCLGKGKEHFLQ